jgi:hypothetical protein
MGLLDLFDPTRSWEPAAGPAPDPSGLRISALPFGSPLESARFLGRPDVFEWKSRLEKECTLLYASRGLRLHFQGGLLDVVTYLIGHDACSHPSFTPSLPMAPDGTRLTPDMDRARIVSIFGEPDPLGSDEETLQVFHGGGAISDFQIDEHGHLREWDLYADD